MDLTQKRCVPCEGDFPAMTLAQARDMMENVPGWSLSEEGTVISREFAFKDFAEALAFTNKIGELAEEEGHHPDIFLAWGEVRITLTTHAVKGLSENDFILAAKIGAIG
jgi:4a-hydroxytetrahydrobiopterin dehydratase